jgi:hypothetical protein
MVPELWYLNLVPELTFKELDFKELTFKELGVLCYLMGVPIYWAFPIAYWAFPIPIGRSRHDIFWSGT